MATKFHKKTKKHVWKQEPVAVVGGQLGFLSIIKGLC